MERKRKILSLIGLIFGIITFVVAMVVAIIFVTDVFSNLSDPDNDISGFMFIFLAIFLFQPILFAVAGVLEIFKFKQKVARKGISIAQLIILIESSSMLIMNFIMNIFELSGLVICLMTVLVCVILGFVGNRKNEDKKVEKLNSKVQARFCVNCGSKIEKGNEFCGKCGMKISKE